MTVDARMIYQEFFRNGVCALSGRHRIFAGNIVLNGDNNKCWHLFRYVWLGSGQYYDLVKIIFYRRFVTVPTDIVGEFFIFFSYSSFCLYYWSSIWPRLHCSCVTKINRMFTQQGKSTNQPNKKSFRHVHRSLRK